MPQLKVKKGTKAPDGDGTHYNPREDPCVPGKVGTGTREALRGHILAKNVPKRDKVHGPNPNPNPKCLSPTTNGGFLNSNLSSEFASSYSSPEHCECFESTVTNHNMYFHY